MHANSKPHSRLGCSTISFRHLRSTRRSPRSLSSAFAEIDLGALPGHPISNLI